jgi:hypothetical protein
VKQFQEFELFDNKIQEFYNQNSVKLSGQLQSLQVGQLCVAIYGEDKAWYRAIVKECLKNNEYKVFYIDYGNTEIVNIANIRKIVEQFIEYPSIAIKCCLRKVKPNPSVQNQDLVDMMYEILAEKSKCRFFTKYDENTWLVDIKTEKNGDFAKNILDLNLVLPDTHQDLPKTTNTATNTSLVCPTTIATTIQKANNLVPSLTFEEGPALKKNDLYETIITHVATISEFSIQLASDKELLSNLNLDLKFFYDKKINHHHPSKFDINLPCIYFDDEKNQWCRAKIMQLIANDYIAIKLVDYGQIKCVYRTLIKTCDEKFLKPHSLVYSASTPIDKQEESKLDELNIIFKQNSLNKQFICKILDVKVLNETNEIKYSVNLIPVKTHDFVKELVQMDTIDKPSLDNNYIRSNEYVRNQLNDSPFPVHTYNQHDQRTNGYPMNRNPNAYNINNNRYAGSGDNANRQSLPLKSNKFDNEREFYTPNKRTQNTTPIVGRFQPRVSESENHSQPIQVRK